MENSHKDLPGPRIPVSTYRLQFNLRFRFSDASRIISYLHELGVTDVYASPYFRARKGSLHGYEIVDYNSLNPEVGTEEEYHEFVRELGRHGMGQILDIVPNHMCIACDDNAWWTDVLENGRSSFYADFFDIDWTPLRKGLANKILIPILSDQYGNVLENQELQLIFERGAFFLTYYENRFPVMPDTYEYILKNRIAELEGSLSADNPHFVEFLSIITALNHLPQYTEKDPEKIAERYREKEIIKQRLSKLCDESTEVRNFIAENVKLFNGLKGSHRSFDLLDELLNNQVWRLSHWRVATEEINYRRFFDINSLGAIKMEDPVVFHEANKLTFQLIKEGAVTGLRVDHIDGLYNPSEYLERLQKNCFVQMRLSLTEKTGDTHDGGGGLEEIVRDYEEVVASDAEFKPFYIIGEKILAKGEKTPGLPFFGTTGYVFLNSVNGIFVETGNARAFDEIYRKFIRSRVNFPDIAYEKKKLVMEVSMSGEVNALAQHLNCISEKNRHTRDFTLNSLTKAITEVIAFFPVYRTYTNSLEVKDRDRQYIETALSKAKRKNPAISAYIFDFLRDILLLNVREDYEADDKDEWLDFAMRFQQITGPVMAKGLEDTAFYAFTRLTSLNEVGGSPDRFGVSLEAFHGQNIERMKAWPHALITTSTHDTKRSEDVRARINVLSEIPQKWKECLAKWGRNNKKNKEIVDGQAVPDRNEEYLLYQTLIGTWPLIPGGENGYGSFKDRIKNYMLKAVREAKINTSWINPNIAYEDALARFIEAIMSDKSENHFLKDFRTFQKMISHCGIYNSLSQTLLKITSPGVPDTYQGTELWDFSLVDPDNRRPVDYTARIDLLKKIKEKESQFPSGNLLGELNAHKENGAIKLYVVYKALTYRRERKETFERGEYLPLDAGGKRANNVCAFMRKSETHTVFIAVPRFFTELTQPNKPPYGDKVWEDSVVLVPSETEGARYRNIFTDEVVTAAAADGKIVLYLSQIFATFPVALMEKMS